MADEGVIETLADKAAIQDLMARYFVGLDRRDFTMVGNCFAPEAKASYTGLGEFIGREAIVKALRVLERIKRSYHLMMDLTIELHGQTAKTGTYASASVVQTKEGKEILNTQGLRYEDMLVKRDGRWQIAERKHLVDWQRDTPVEVPTPVRREVFR